MSPDETRQKLVEAAVALLQARRDPAKIGVRDIAEKAGVGLGVVNYHFGSKDALLGEAVGFLMMDNYRKRIEVLGQDNIEPREQLRRFLKENSAIGFEWPELTRAAMLFELTAGRHTVPALILPFLRRIYGDRKSGQELALLAFALVATLQDGFLCGDNFSNFVGIPPYVEDRELRGVDVIMSLLPE